MQAMAEFPYAPTLTSADNGNHAPGTQPLWQESCSFRSSTRCTGSPPSIASAHTNRGEASVYSWTEVGGKIVSRAKRTGLALPGGPVTGRRSKE
jgi:hypothetical protein